MIYVYMDVFVVGWIESS